MKISQMEKRVRRLEEKQKAEPDLVRDALGCMKDFELDLFEEAARLRECGHTKEEVAAIMGHEKWQRYHQVTAHFNEEYEELRKHCHK